MLTSNGLTDHGISLALRALRILRRVVPSRPNSLGDSQALRERLQHVDEEQVRPVNAFVRRLRREHAGVPFVDPLYGGIKARVLILMEAPGPLGAQRTNLLSLDNPDGTAANLFRFVEAAGLARTDLLSWNAVPWPSERLTSVERAKGVDVLLGLLDLLPRLRVVIPMGRPAQQCWQSATSRARKRIEWRGTWHPGGLGLARPGRREEVLATLRWAARQLD